MLRLPSNINNILTDRLLITSCHPRSSKLRRRQNDDFVLQRQKFEKSLSLISWESRASTNIILLYIILIWILEETVVRQETSENTENMFHRSEKYFFTLKIHKMKNNAFYFFNISKCFSKIVYNKQSSFGALVQW